MWIVQKIPETYHTKYLTAYLHSKLTEYMDSDSACLYTITNWWLHVELLCSQCAYSCLHSAADWPQLTSGIESYNNKKKTCGIKLQLYEWLLQISNRGVLKISHLPLDFFFFGGGSFSPKFWIFGQSSGWENFQTTFWQSKIRQLATMPLHCASFAGHCTSKFCWVCFMLLLCSGTELSNGTLLQSQWIPFSIQANRVH